MTELFLKIVNMSISASWLVLVVVLLRLFLKKTPKWLNVTLWGLVGIRLAVSFSVKSIFSLIPSSETLSPDIMLDPIPMVNTGIPVLNRAINPVISDSLSADPGASVNPLQVWVFAFAIIWIVGMVLMLAYTAISYCRLRRRIALAVPMEKNIYQCEALVSPFVLGLICPRVYLPFNLKEQYIASIVAHEKAHIERRDHWWKPLGFLLLTIYWFNPLMWLAYVLLCRDIELACDEKVIRKLDNEQRADYSEALLACSVNRRMIAACPLVFGEVGVKERVKSVLNYKKPAFWVIVVAVIAYIIVAVCFLTDPAKQHDTLVWAQELSAADVLSADLVVFPQSEDKQFKSLSKDDISVMLALINQSKGKYQAEHEELAGGSIFFYIILKDGTTHSVGNIENIYLVIDGDYYEAKYEWLTTWYDDFGEGNMPLPEEYFSGHSYSQSNAEPEEQIDIQTGTEDVDAFMSRYSETAAGQDMLIWEDADLDHDGKNETIRVREVAEGQLYEISVVREDGTCLWSTEAAYAHAGWKTILLYQEAGKDYLIQYLPAMYQGVGSYSWTQFSLEGGKPLEAASMDVDFELPIQMNSKLRGFAERTNWILENSTVLLSTEQGELVTGPKAAVEVPQLYPVLFDPSDVQTNMSGAAENTNNLFVDGQPLEFLFASGAGGWGTTLTLYPDGSFEGEYHDSDMGVNAPEYPHGTIYVCKFSGHFSEMTQLTEHAYSMRLEELIYEEAGREWIEDQIRYIASEPYGLAGGENFALYVPDTPADQLNEEFLSWWPDAYLWREGSLDTLSAYGLYNCNTGEGFFTSWLK